MKWMTMAAIMRLGRGTRLGPYASASLPGAGGMGGVYRARDTRLDISGPSFRAVVAAVDQPSHR